MQHRESDRVQGYFDLESCSCILTVSRVPTKLVGQMLCLTMPAASLVGTLLSSHIRIDSSSSQLGFKFFKTVVHHTTLWFSSYNQHFSPWAMVQVSNTSNHGSLIKWTLNTVEEEHRILTYNGRNFISNLNLSISPPS